MKPKNNISLEDTGKRLPFAVPENYFEEFALQMDNQTEIAKVSVIKIMKPWLYLAAMFVGVFIIGNAFYSIHTNNIAKNTENYELYMVSQVDESLVYDNYVNEENTENTDKK